LELTGQASVTDRNTPAQDDKFIEPNFKKFKFTFANTIRQHRYINLWGFEHYLFIQTDQVKKPGRTEAIKKGFA